MRRVNKEAGVRLFGGAEVLEGDFHSLPKDYSIVTPLPWVAPNLAVGES